jgi:predicted nucleotidyltransferase
MSLPEFNEKGDLPPGVYRVSMGDVLARFGIGSRMRKRAAATLQQIVQLSESTHQLDRLVLFGSFVTAKPDPNDIDVILVMNDRFQLEKCSPVAAVLFDHARAQVELGASVF